MNILNVAGLLKSIWPGLFKDNPSTESVGEWFKYAIAEGFAERDFDGGMITDEGLNSTMAHLLLSQRITPFNWPFVDENDGLCWGSGGGDRPW